MPNLTLTASRACAKDAIATQYMSLTNEMQRGFIRVNMIYWPQTNWETVSRFVKKVHLVL
jgi:hypothetical protein